MSEVRRCPGCQAELPPDAPDGFCANCLQVHGLPTADAPAGMTPPRTTPHPRAPFTAPEPADLAAHFPHLEILDLLGQGGMGAVYKARQSKLDRMVALKVLPPEVGGDSAFAEHFTREARALARLNHPNIVTVYDFGQSGNLFYFLMEYVDGLNLRRLLHSGRVQPQEALKIVPQVCDALQFAHDEGVIHRDIKPENILLDKRGRVKIADFGIAKIIGRNTGIYTLTGPWQVMGTLHYMAPEQMDNPLKVDHRADIYSLGVVFYEMLTGQLPLGRFAPPSHKVGTDLRLDHVVLRALENEPDRRYQHASQVKTDVEAITAGGPGVYATFTPSQTLSGPAGSVVLPVKTSAWGGFGEARGLARLEGDQLILELEITILGLAKAGVREYGIPLGGIGSACLESKWFSNKLVLVPRRLRSLAEVPGSKEGKVELQVARRDLGLAQQLVAELNERLASGTLAGPGLSQTAPPGNFAERVLKPAVQGIVQGGISFVRQIRTFIATRAGQQEQPPTPWPTSAPPALPQPFQPSGSSSLPSVLPAPPEEPALSVLPVEKPITSVQDTLEKTRKRMRFPSALLTITGVTSILVMVGMIIASLLTQQTNRGGIDASTTLPLFGLLGCTGPAILLGARQMRRLASRRAAMASALLALFAPLWFLGFPAGLLALWRLSRKSIKDAFDQQRRDSWQRETGVSGTEVPEPAGWLLSFGRVLGLTLSVVGVLTLLSPWLGAPTHLAGVEIGWADFRPMVYGYQLWQGLLAGAGFLISFFGYIAICRNERSGFLNPLALAVIALTLVIGLAHFTTEVAPSVVIPESSSKASGVGVQFVMSNVLFAPRGALAISAYLLVMGVFEIVEVWRLRRKTV